MPVNKTPDHARLDRIVAEARRNAAERELSYRERALKLYPWVCGRCAREFTHVNLQQLTVHHRDHNHSNNAADGSNWELLCIYCHENEHAKQLDAAGRTGVPSGGGIAASSTFQPFADLKSLLGKKS
jgi:5-methylcytosine-specific restriction endonuclease McrA